MKPGVNDCLIKRQNHMKSMEIENNRYVLISQLNLSTYMYVHTYIIIS